MPQVIAFVKSGFAFIASAGASGSALAAAVVATATVAASRMLKPKVNFNIDDGDRSRQQTVRSTIEPRKLVYGETMVSGPLTYAKVTGSNNEYLHQVVALAGHELTAIKEVHFDDKSIDLTGGNYNSSTKLVTGGFFGPQKNESGVSESIVYIDTRLGAATQTAFAALRSNSETSSEYLETHRGDGVAAIYTRWLINEGSAEVWDEVGNVQNIKCVVQGKKVYDPRLDVNAGNTAGDNPTTAAYIKYDDDTLSTGSAQGNYDRGEQGKNPALQLADFLMDSDFGLGIPASKIDWAAVVTAADICDQLVPIPTSAVQKRFAGSGVIFGADTYSASISKILSAMNGSLVYSQGKYIMTAGKYVSPSETLTEDDLVGPVQIRTAIPRSDRVNTIKGLFIDPSENYKMMEFGPVTIGASDFNNQTKGAVARDNGEVLTEEIKLPFTDNRYQAQRLALMQVAQSYHQTIVTVPVNLKGMRIAIGDRVNLTLTDFNNVDSGNWSPKVFKCIGWRFAEDGEGINLTLIEDDSNNYNDPEESDYSTITAAGVISTALPDVPSPQGLTLTSAINAIELNWTNPSNIGAWEQIWIYRNTTGTTPTDSDTPIAKLRASSYIDQRAAAGSDGTLIEYYYWIQAVRYPQGSTPSSGSTNKAKSAMVAAGTPASGKIAATKIGQGVMDSDSVGAPQVIDDSIGSDQIAITLQSDNYVANTSGWQINKDGTAYFQEATIQGGITATTGSIGGITVTSTSLESSNFSSGSAGFKLESNGTFETGNGTFRGTVNATSGDFTGNVSTDSKFIAGSGATSATMDGNDPNFKFYAGAATPGDSPFKVDAGGVVTADRIVITRPDDSSAVIFDSAQDGLVGVGLAALSADSDNAVVQVADELTSNTDYARLILSASSQTLTIKVLFPLGYAPFAISSAEDFPDSITIKLQLAAVTNGTPGTFVDVNGGTKTFTRRAYNASDASDDDYYSVNTSGTGWYIKGKDGIDDQFNLVMTDSSVYTVGDQAIRVQVSYVAGSGGTNANPSSSSKRTVFFNSATQYFTIDSNNIIRDQAPGSVLTGDVILSAASGARTISWRDTDNQNENWSIEGLTGYQESGSGILNFKFDNGSSTPISFVSNGNILSTGDFYTGTGAITAATASIGGGYGSTGLSIANNGNLSTDGDVIIGGDLTVSGTTTTIDTANLNVEDKNITLNYGTGDTSANANGAGITIQDAVNSSTDATILWDATNDEFDFSHGATFAGGISAKNATLTDDGSSSPILKISADDNGPWAIQLYREDLSGGPQVYASSASTWSFQGHIDLRSGYGYNVNSTTVIDSNRNLTNIGTISSGAITSRGDSGSDSIMRIRNTNSTSKMTRLQFEDSSGSVGDALIAYVHSDANSANHYLGMGVNNNTTLKIDNNDNATFTGDVGVSGATPNSYSGYGTLTISGSTGSLVDLEVGGTLTGEMFVNSIGLGFQTLQADDDIFFKGNDGGSMITALTLDMSASGHATFNSGLKTNGTIENDSSGHAYLFLDNGGSHESGIIFQKNNTSKWEAPYISSGNDNLKFYSYPGSGLQMQIRDGVNGNGGTILSGLGVTDPNAFYGDYGALLLNSTSEFTSSSRGWMITNAYEANKFALLYSSSATSLPSLSTNGAVASGTSVGMSIDNAGTAYFSGRVGLGHSNPAHDLTVYNASGPTLYLVGGSYDDDIRIAFGGGSPNQATANGNTGAQIISTQSVSSGQARGNLVFKTNGGDSLQTALTLDLSQNATFANLVGINKGVNSAVALSVGADATATTSYALEVCNSSANTRFLVDGVGNAFFAKTDNSYAMRWDAVNSRLGVNTSSPGMTLDVRGNARIGDGTSGEQDIYFAAGSGAWQVGTNASGNGTSNNQFYIYDDAYRFTVQKGTGHVGIGTNSPTAELHLKDTGGLSRIRLEGTATSADNFEFGQGTTGVTNGGFEIRDIDAAATRLVINSSGRVGINVMNPLGQLQVSGATAPSTHGGIVFVRNTGATASNTTFGGIHFSSSPGTDYSIGKANVNATTTLSFRNGNTGASLMDLDASGNLSISNGLITTGVGTIGQRLTITPDGGSGYVGGALRIRTHNDYRGAGVFLHNTADNDTWYAGTPYTNHDHEYIIAFQPSVSQSNPEQTAQGAYSVWRVTYAGRSTQRGSHAEARTHLKYEYSGENNYNNADLLTWASEPGITYYGTGIGANVHPNGQYYGRADTSQPYMVYMRFLSSNGDVEFWNSTGSAAGGQGTKRATIQADGDIVATNGYFTGSAYRIATSDGRLEGHYGVVWDQTTQGTGKGTLHLDPNTSANNAGGAITFGASDAQNGTTAHAGIYVRSDGAYGTKMYLSTTDSYASGSKSAITITHQGTVTINRSSLTAAGNITAYSDIRLKDRIEQIPDALNKILSIRGVTYQRTDQKENKRQMGVIAQELEAAGLHEVVDDSGEYKSVAYGNLFGLAVEAIRELKQENDELKEMLNSIMEKLNGD